MPTKTAARTAKKSPKKSKKLPVCTKKDLRTPKRKRRKCTVPTKGPVRVSPTGGAAAPPVTAPAASAAVIPFVTSPDAVAALVVVVPDAADPTASPETQTLPGNEAPGSSTEVPQPTSQPPAPAGDPAPSTPQDSIPSLPVLELDSSGVVTAAAPVEGVQVYSGPFGVPQATRLLFRAGFGPKPGQAEQLAALGVRGAVDALMRPSGTIGLYGPVPTGSYLVGGTFAPKDKYGHLHLQWLDRMVRSNDSLTERITLILHDWFGIGDAGAERQLVYGQIDLFRRKGRGSFRQLLKDVTADPAMLRCLDGTINRKGFINENYAREFMELYTLGADRGAYSEYDVKELARSFTGFRHDWDDTIGPHNFRFDSTRFDSGSKTLFGGRPFAKSGNLNFQSAIDAIVDHPMHPSFVVTKLWSYFVPTGMSDSTKADLEALYRSSGERLDSLIEAILLHPDLYQGPTMVKPPVVYAAGLMRARNMGIATDNWIFRLHNAGQRLGNPPNVSGWNDRAWLNTSTYSARWACLYEILPTGVATAAEYKGKTETPDQAIQRALAYWSNPPITGTLLASLQRIASEEYSTSTSETYGSRESFLVGRQNILRQLIAGCPDAQVS